MYNKKVYLVYSSFVDFSFTYPLSHVHSIKKAHFNKGPVFISIFSTVLIMGLGLLQTFVLKHNFSISYIILLHAPMLNTKIIRINFSLIKPFMVAIS